MCEPAVSFYCCPHSYPIPIDILILVSVCREGPWQRCWASSSPRTLQIGACIGAAMIVVVVFLFSFGGFLAAWSGYFIPTGPDDYGNTVLFSLLANAPGSTVPTVSSTLTTFLTLSYLLIFIIIESLLFIHCILFERNLGRIQQIRYLGCLTC